MFVQAGKEEGGGSGRRLSKYESAVTVVRQRHPILRPRGGISQEGILEGGQPNDGHAAHVLRRLANVTKISVLRRNALPKRTSQMPAISRDQRPHPVRSGDGRIRG